MARVSHPCWWGDTVQAVVTKKWQYSSLTDPHDVQLTRYPTRNDDQWLTCMQLADDAINGLLTSDAPGATSYYDDSIPAPKWATPETLVKKIGRINFHRIGYDVEHLPEKIT